MLKIRCSKENARVENFFQSYVGLPRRGKNFFVMSQFFVNTNVGKCCDNFFSFFYKNEKKVYEPENKLIQSWFESIFFLRSVFFGDEEKV